MNTQSINGHSKTSMHCDCLQFAHWHVFAGNIEREFCSQFNPFCIYHSHCERGPGSNSITVRTYVYMCLYASMSTVGHICLPRAMSLFVGPQPLSDG
jgi:hypothetical protein